MRDHIARILVQRPNDLPHEGHITRALHGNSLAANNLLAKINMDTDTIIEEQTTVMTEHNNITTITDLAPEEAIRCIPTAEGVVL